jgi:hypothetical protein
MSSLGEKRPCFARHEPPGYPLLDRFGNDLQRERICQQHVARIREPQRSAEQPQERAYEFRRIDLPMQRTVSGRSRDQGFIARVSRRQVSVHSNGGAKSVLRRKLSLQVVDTLQHVLGNDVSVGFLEHPLASQLIQSEHAFHCNSDTRLCNEIAALRRYSAPVHSAAGLAKLRCALRQPLPQWTSRPRPSQSFDIAAREPAAATLHLAAFHRQRTSSPPAWPETTLMPAPNRLSRVSMSLHVERLANNATQHLPGFQQAARTLR